MATPDEIRRLEQAVRDAQAALTRARAENQRADEAWERMLRQAEQSVVTGKSVTAEFIVNSGARARAAMGDDDGNPKVVPFKAGMLTPEQLLAWTINNGVKPK
jgi:hypothetical protein